MKFLKLLLISLIFCGTDYSQSYKPPSQSESLLNAIDFQKGLEFDRDYKKSFDDCDKLGGKRGCKNDPNKLKTLLRFGDKAVYFDSKMSLDLDGSWVACNCGNSIGASDQCSTSYSWKSFPADYNKNKPKEFCKFYERQDFVDSNTIPYIVIPLQFQNHFKINNQPYNFINGAGADLGVVIFKDKIVPVMVADQGPVFRIGEGSAALFRALGEDRCRKFQGSQCVSFKGGNYSIEQNVLFFVFPNSKISKDKLNKDNALELINREAMRKFEEFKASFNN